MKCRIKKQEERTKLYSQSLYKPPSDGYYPLREGEKKRKEMTTNLYGSNYKGNTRNTMVLNKKNKKETSKKTRKKHLNLVPEMKFFQVKMDSVVIENNYVSVKLALSFVHTARRLGKERKIKSRK